MTLADLLDTAYRSDYIILHDCGAIKRFAKKWKNFLVLDIEDIQLTETPQYGVHPITGERIRKYNTTYKDLLNDEYKYLID